MPGAGGDAWFWHRIVTELESRGHRALPVELPAGNDSAGLAAYADAVVEVIGDRSPVVLVAQSMGGFSAPLCCDRLPVDWLVLLNAMIPRPGETAGEWWGNTGQSEAARANDLREGRDPDAPFDVMTTFLHDVPPDILDWVMGAESGEPVDSLFTGPLGLERWPDVPTTVLAGREDRLFPLEFQVRVAQERLGLAAEPLPGGHLVALSQPAALVKRLLAGPGQAPTRS